MLLAVVEKYVRSGSSLKNLKDYPEKESSNCGSPLNRRPFEREYAKTACTFEEIKELIDVISYLKTMGYFEDSNDERDNFSYESKDGVIESSGKTFNLTKYGQTFTLSAKNLKNFENLSASCFTSN